MKENNFPDIRFSGFLDEWNSYYLENIGKDYSGLYGKTKKDFGHGKGKFIPYINVFNNPISQVSLLECIEIDKNQNVVKFGDILFTISSETPQEVGMSSIWLGNMENIYLNSFCFGYRLFITFNPYYFAYLFRSPNIRKKIMLLAQGISRYNISKNKMMNIEIPIPDIKEQEKIGKLFKNLDYKLNFELDIIQKLNNLKQAMLEKMFPKENSNIPELRFKGFTDVWEQRKLGDVAIEMVAGGDVDKDLILDEGRYPVIANALTNDGIVGYYNEDYRIKAPAVTVTGRGDVGHAKARIVDFTPVVRLLSIKSNHDVFFLENAINTLKIVIESTGVPQLTVPQLVKYEISFPKSLDEEEKIGTYFRHLDHLITLHQRKCKYFL